MKLLTIRLEDKLYRAFKGTTGHQGKLMSSVIREVIQKYVDKYSVIAPPPTKQPTQGNSQRPYEIDGEYCSRGYIK